MYICTDRQIDGLTDGEGEGSFQYLPSRAFDAAGDNKLILLNDFDHL